jgi:tetratricopeptide (TPR) repeat protein
MKKLFLITTLLLLLATMPTASFAQNPLRSSLPLIARGDIKTADFDEEQGKKAFLANDFKSAKYWYGAAQKVVFYDEYIELGLARSCAALGDYATAKKSYETVINQSREDRDVKIMAEYSVVLCRSGICKDQQILDACNKVLDICQNDYRATHLNIPAQQIISEQGNNSANKTIEAIMHLVLAIHSSMSEQKPVNVKSELDLATSLEPTSATIASYRAKLLKPTPASGSVTLAIPATPAVASPK